MSTKRLIIVAVIFALALLLGFALFVPRASEPPGALHPAVAPASAPAVTVRDSFRKGVHTITGTVEAPDACSTATAQASVTGTSTSEQILLSIQMPSTDGVCLQLPTKLDFSTTLSAAQNLPLSVTVNGLPATVSAP